MPYRFTASVSPTLTLASFSQISCYQKTNYHQLREFCVGSFTAMRRRPLGLERR